MSDKSEKKEAAKKKERERFHYVQALVLSLTCSFFLFLYAPFELYFSNKSDFWFDFYSMIGIDLALFVGCAAFIYLLLFLSNLIHPILYRVIYCAGAICFFCLYIEGNFLAKDLPMLDGRDIDWNALSTHRVFSILVIAILIAAVVVLVRIVKFKKAEIILQYALLGLSAILLITVITEGVMNNGFAKKTRIIVNKDGEFDYSTDRNVIILVIDAVDGDVFEEALKDHPEYYDDFKDFTYYRNMMSTYTQTRQSIPYLFSGVWFEGGNSDAEDQYITDSIKDSEMLNRLAAAGYRLGFYEVDALPGESERLFSFENVKKDRIPPIDVSSFLKSQTKLVGYRYAPLDLKRKCVVYYRDFLTDSKSAAKDNLFYDYNDGFLNDVHNAEFATSEEKCFKLLHIEGAHVPFRYDSYANKVESGTYKESVEASVYVAAEYIKKLKEIGVYDNSVILIMADHGFSEEDIEEGRLHPVFFVKGLNETGSKMSISDAPVSFEDLPEAFRRLENGIDSSGIFDWKEGDERDRRCYVLFYKNTSHIHYEECVLKGRAGDVTKVEKVK